MSKNISLKVNLQWESYQNARLCKLHPPKDQNFRIKFPRRFRSLRALAVASWYLPDWFKYEILLYLGTDFIYSLDPKTNGFKQSLELRTLVSSESIFLRYLEERFSKRELFGTVLQEDLFQALRETEIILEYKGPVVRTIRRKGYKDKGTWRLPHRWLPQFDYSYTIEQNEREKRKFAFNLLLTYTRHTLE